MPASRSARAMIFAPRSCPSRPGFAITTRIFLAMPRSLRPLLESGMDSYELQRPLDALDELPFLGRAVDLAPIPRCAQVHPGEFLLHQRFLGKPHEVQRRTQRPAHHVCRLMRAIGGCKPDVRDSLERDDARPRARSVDG